MEALKTLRHEFQMLTVLFREYLEARNLSPRTVDEYPDAIRPFLTHIEAQDVENIRSVTVRHIQSYHGLLMERTYKKRPLAPRTVEARLIQVKSFFRFLHKTGKIYHDPMSGYELPKRGRSLPRNILSEKEMLRLIEAPGLSTHLGVRDRAIIELLYSSGLRNSELCNLELTDLDSENQTLYILGKGNVEELVPYGGETKKALENYLLFSRKKLFNNYCGARPKSEKQLKIEAGRQYVFITKNGHRIHPSNLQYIILKHAKAAGIEKRVGPHTLRHTCATHLLKNGADIRQIQQLLRHRDINTTQIYTHVEIGDLKLAQMKFHPRERSGNE